MGTNTKEMILKAASEKGLRFLDLQFTDIVGMVKNITVPLSQLESVLDNGIWFDGSSIEGFARISESDMFLRPDLDTFAFIPWQNGEHKTARIICNVFTPSGERFMGAPRTALQVALEEAAELGYDFRTGPELEFFLFKTDENGDPIPGATHDDAGYFDSSIDRGTYVRQAITTALEGFGIEVEAAHHEVAKGQQEIDFKYGNALKSADSAVTFKLAAKAIAEQNGLHATFMPKPIAKINGSGMHVHMSFADIKTGENLFADDSDPYSLSKIAKYFMAGILKHARALAGVVAPTVNSYKRLVPGYEAPVYVSWARINRSALIRIPRFAVPAATRIELRCPDPSCNPYLAFSVMLKAGLDGIKNELELIPPTEENLFESEWAREGLTTLPGSLGEAIEEMQKDPIIEEALGSHIYERFIDAKKQEWDEYRISVSPWELDRYMKKF